MIVGVAPWAIPRVGANALQELYEDDGNIEALFTTFWRLPLLYLTLMAVRFVCIALFNPLFQLTNAGMNTVASSLLLC